MRWIFICCLLMTVTVIKAAEQNNTKSKRDISFIKDFFFSKLFGGGEENQTAEPSKVLIQQPVSFRLFRIPSSQKFENKDTAQNVVNVVESQSIGGHPSIAIVSSYLGTNTLNETLDALKGVRTLLQSGVLEAKHDRVSTNIAPVTLHYATPSLVPSTLTESKKVVVEIENDEQNYPHVLNSVVPIPLRPYGQVYPVKELRPQRVSFPEFPNQYSYEQVYNDRVNSYHANGNRNVIVTERKNAIPLPHYIGQRFEEILALGVKPIQRLEPQAAIASLNINRPSISAHIVGMPKVPLNLYKPVKVQPSPNGYSYQHLHNDGTVTTYSGTGLVEEHKIELPAPIPNEIPKPLPIHNIHIDGYHRGSAHSEIASKPPTPTLIKESFYGRPGLIYQEPYPIVVHRIPGYVPISSDHITKEAHTIHNSEHQIPHQFRPVIVHQDFSSEISNKNSPDKMEKVKQQQTSFNRSMAYNKPVSAALAYNFVNDRHLNNMSSKVKIVCKDDSHTSHVLNAHNAVHAQLGPDTKRGGYLYTAVHKDGSITRYSGTGETKENNNVHVAPPVVFLSSVTEKVVIDEDDKKFASQPLVSQYVYKQINHHSPEDFTVVNINDIHSGDIQVNVQAGTKYSSTHVTPNPDKDNASSHPSGYISKIPNEYLFIPPKSTKDSMPTMNYNVTKNYSQSFTQLTSQGVYTNRDGSADFLSQTSAPVPKVSEFTSSTSIPSTAAASSTTSTALNNSLSANPIVVLPDPDTFSYTHNKADGSTVKIHGSLNNVSVADDSAKHRGDIPDTFL